MSKYDLNSFFCQYSFNIFKEKTQESHYDFLHKMRISVFRQTIFSFRDNRAIKVSMKTAISIDTLLERDHSTKLLNILCELLPEAPIYTLVHQKGRLRNLKKKRVCSSFLSHKIQHHDQVGHYFFALPSAATHLFIPCKYGLVFNISRGLSHGIKKCKKSLQVTYLYDNYWTEKKSDSIREKLFKSYVKHWSRKAIGQIDELWVSSAILYGYFQHFHSNVQLIPSHDESEFARLTQLKIKNLLPKGL